MVYDFLQEVVILAKLALVGATGAVGQEMLKIMEERQFPVDELICLADPKEAGTRVKFRGEDLVVQAADEAVFKKQILQCLQLEQK